MTYDFITIGGATRDISFFTDQGVLLNNRRDVLRQKLLAFEYGAKIKVDKFYYSFGGGAANSAVNLTNFGFKTACLLMLGADEAGSLILKNLRQHGVDSSLVKINKREESGASFILIARGGERIIFGARGANRCLAITAADQKVLKKTKNIYLASLSGPWWPNLARIFSLASPRAKKKVKIFWNPGASQYKGGLKKLAAFLPRVTVFALNKDEAIELVLSSSRHRHLSRAFLNRTDNLLRLIYNFGPKIVLITLGKAGAAAYDGHKIYRQRIFKEKKRVDTTGIGDIFNSTFAAAYELFKGDIKKALRLAMRNAAAKIGHLGAQNGLLKFTKKF